MREKEITAELADFIERTFISAIPDDVVKNAKLLIADFLGVTVAGSGEESARMIQRLVEEQGLHGNATIMGTAIKSHATWASLANGIAGHALDYDDVSQPMYGHPTVPVLPAVLALGESLHINGVRLIESYIIGVEVTVKLSHGMNPAHYKRGWHSTCTLGTLGSAAAAAKLLGLKGGRLRSALAMAASQACGLQQNFGTMTKPFHAGRAAENGVLSALLSERGWTGNQNILEAPLGFFDLFCGPGNYDAQRCIDNLGTPYDIEYPGIILKKYPSCAFSHPAVDAAMAIASDPHYDRAAVDRVEGCIHELADQILIHRNPHTGLEAKFSLEACVALALVDGKVNIQSFTDEKILSKPVREMMTRIERKVVPSSVQGPVEFGPAFVKVFLKNEKVMESIIEKAKGNPENPLTREEVREKYRDCCSQVLPESSLDKSLSLVDDLEKLSDVSELMACFSLPPAKRHA
ncbi:MAG: MmgE/PrpD family protein [Pseudomonadota bacterium]